MRRPFKKVIGAFIGDLTLSSRQGMSGWCWDKSHILKGHAFFEANQLPQPLRPVFPHNRANSGVCVGIVLESVNKATRTHEEVPCGGLRLMALTRTHPVQHLFVRGGMHMNSRETFDYLPHSWMHRGRRTQSGMAWVVTRSSRQQKLT